MLFDNFISIFFSFKIKQVCHNRKTIPNVCLQQGYRSHADKCGSPFKSIPENLWQFFFIITFGFFLSFWNILNQLNEQAMKIEKNNWIGMGNWHLHFHLHLYPIRTVHYSSNVLMKNIFIDFFLSSAYGFGFNLLKSVNPTNFIKCLRKRPNYFRISCIELWISKKSFQMCAPSRKR